MQNHNYVKQTSTLHKKAQKQQIDCF